MHSKMSLNMFEEKKSAPVCHVYWVNWDTPNFLTKLFIESKLHGSKQLDWWWESFNSYVISYCIIVYAKQQIR